MNSACVKLVAMVVVLCAIGTLTAAERARLVVCPFSYDATDTTEAPKLQRLLPQLLIRAFERTDALDVVDRTRTQEAFDSLALARLGVIEPRAVGKLLGARYIVMGKLIIPPVPGTYIVNVSVDNVTTGELTGAGENQQIKLETMCDFVNDAAVKIARAIAPDRRVHKPPADLGSRNPAALMALGKALLQRDAHQYEVALATLKVAAQADPRFAEVDKQRTEITGLMQLQRRLQGSSDK